MAARKIYLAIVRSQCKIYRDREYDLDKVLEKKLNDSDKHENVRFELVAWDVPNNWEKFTHILLGSGIDYASHPNKFLSWLDNLSANAARKVLNSPSIIRWNMNKKYLADLKKAGIDLPPTLFLDDTSQIDPQEIINGLKNKATEDVKVIVVKNQIDAGGASTRRIKLEKPNAVSETELVLIREMLERSNSGVLVQNFLPRILTEGEWSVIYFDRKLSHCAVKTPSENDFRVQSRFGGKTEIIEIKKVPRPVLELSNKVIESVAPEKKLFYARVDVIRDDEDKPCLMELEAFEPDLYYRNDQIIDNFLAALYNPNYSINT